MPQELNDVEAQENTDKIRHLLKTQGWCFVDCQFLNNETIAIIRNSPPLRDFEREMLEEQAGKLKQKLSGKDGKIVYYTLSEFLILCDSPSALLVHETKKLGAEIKTGE